MEKELSRRAFATLVGILGFAYAVLLLPFVLERYTTSCDTEVLAVTCELWRVSLSGIKGWIAVSTLFVGPVCGFIGAWCFGGRKARWVAAATPGMGIIILSIVLAGYVAGSEFGLFSIWLHGRS